VRKNDLKEITIPLKCQGHASILTPQDLNVPFDIGQLPEQAMEFSSSLWRAHK